MYDIAVIGGGPAGLSAAIQVRARNKSVLVVSGDDRDNPLYKTSRIDNYLVPNCWSASAPTPDRWGRSGGTAGC